MKIIFKKLAQKTTI